MKRLVLLACILVVPVASAYAQFNFTNIDCPGSTLTTTRRINNHGEMVGADRIVPPRHAVLIKGGQCIPLAPATVLGTNQSEAFKNNDRGDVVGYFLDNSGTPHGYFLSKKGVLTQLDFPGASDTEAWGINESGTVVGFFDEYDSGGNLIAEHGFTWNGGNFTQVDYPGSGDTAVTGINASGDLVGVWDPGPTATVGHGFIRTKQGEFISFNVPIGGATLTQINDINANDQILGVYIDALGAEHGFLQVGATFTAIDYPGAVTTSAWGINSSGQIVGNYVGGDGLSHGYLAVANGNISGVFADAPVVGLSYSCGSTTDVTKSGGAFTCPQNSTVTFTVGGITICNAPAQAFMTPVSCAQANGDPSANASTPSVVATAQFVISIGTPTGTTPGALSTLTITSAELQAASGLSLDFSTATQAQLQTAVSTVNPGQTLASASTAQNELAATVATKVAGSYSGTYSGTDSGTWTVMVDTSGNVSGTYTGSVNGNGTIAGTLVYGTTFKGSAGNSTWIGTANTSKPATTGTGPYLFSGSWINPTNGGSGSFTN